jgi:hypothetical protein
MEHPKLETADFATDALLIGLRQVHLEQGIKEPFREWALKRFEGQTYLQRKVRNYFDFKDKQEKLNENK